MIKIAGGIFVKEAAPGMRMAPKMPNKVMPGAPGAAGAQPGRMMPRPPPSAVMPPAGQQAAIPPTATPPVGQSAAAPAKPAAKPTPVRQTGWANNNLNQQHFPAITSGEQAVQPSPGISMLSNTSRKPRVTDVPAKPGTLNPIQAKNVQQAGGAAGLGQQLWNLGQTQLW